MASPRLPTALQHAVELTRDTLPPMHPAGRPFVLGGAAATMLLRTLSPAAGVLGAVATVCCAAFFREPHRTTPLDPELAIAPADGTVSSIEPAPPPAEVGLGTEPRPRVFVLIYFLVVHV
ncbi:MAG: phosphatidylserine decarboxylase, partial [Pseudonocardiaceae bacterium]